MTFRDGVGCAKLSFVGVYTCAGVSPQKCICYSNVSFSVHCCCAVYHSGCFFFLYTGWKYGFMRFLEFEGTEYIATLFSPKVVVSVVQFSLGVCQLVSTLHPLVWLLFSMEGEGEHGA